MPRYEIVREHAPGPLRVTNADGARKLIDRDGKFYAILETFVGERLRNLDPAGAAVITLRSVCYVGPAFQENASMPILLECRMAQHFFGRCAFMNYVQAAFEADKVFPWSAAFSPPPD